MGRSPSSNNCQIGCHLRSIAIASIFIEHQSNRRRSAIFRTQLPSKQRHLDCFSTGISYSARYSSTVCPNGPFDVRDWEAIKETDEHRTNDIPMFFFGLNEFSTYPWQNNFCAFHNMLVHFQFKSPVKASNNL